MALVSSSVREDKEYALRPVPATARLALLATVLLWASLTLDPSAPYLAMWWATLSSLSTLVVSVLCANLALSVFSSLSGYIASREGLTYALAAERVYGIRGALVPSLWAGIVAIGWLAFSIGVVADSLVKTVGVQEWVYYPLVLALTGLFSITAYKGVKHIVKLASIGVPLLVVLILAGIVLSTGRYGAPALGPIEPSSLPTLTTLVLGTFVNGSIVLSFDYQRFCRKPRDAVLTAFTNFLGFWSFIIILSAIPATILGKDLISTYVALGIAPLAAIALFVLAWTSADNQLYSASLSWTLGLKTLDRIVDRRALVVAGAIITVILAEVKLHTFALDWLSLLTSISLPAGIVLWTDYYVVHRMRWPKSNIAVNWMGFAAWLLGSITIYTTIGRWYCIPLGFLVTFLAYLALSAVRRGRA